MIDKKIRLRIKKEAEYIINTNSTIRQTGKKFNLSKSTIHKDMTERLKELSPKLYNKVEKILNEHIKIRHINGGNATKNKYFKPSS
jgi:putative DeoR family transcriptional regulator (stage III sporulation protein D)